MILHCIHLICKPADGLYTCCVCWVCISNNKLLPCDLDVLPHSLSLIQNNLFSTSVSLTLQYLWLYEYLLQYLWLLHTCCSTSHKVTCSAWRNFHLVSKLIPKLQYLHFQLFIWSSILILYFRQSTSWQCCFRIGINSH